MSKQIPRDGKRSRGPVRVTNRLGALCDVPDLGKLELLAAPGRFGDVEFSFSYNGSRFGTFDRMRPSNFSKEALVLSAAIFFCNAVYGAKEIDKSRQARHKPIVRTVFGKWKEQLSAWSAILDEVESQMTVRGVMED